jgi:hypothetical protein
MIIYSVGLICSLIWCTHLSNADPELEDYRHKNIGVWLAILLLSLGWPLVAIAWLAMLVTRLTRKE